MIKKVLIRFGLLCDHEYHCVNVFIGGTGEKNFKNRCVKCGKVMWVKL